MTVSSPQHGHSLGTSHVAVLSRFSLYHLYEHGYEISHLEGFGDKSFNNMVDAIEKSIKVLTYLRYNHIRFVYLNPVSIA